MKLYLLRHGQAEDRAATDAVRALTEEGRRQILSVAARFRGQGWPLETCLASPYRRARQSAELFLAGAALSPPLETCELLQPECAAPELIRHLQSRPEAAVLLVGHNPLLSECHALLRDGHLRTMTILGTGELLGLTLEIVGQGLGSPLCHLRPDTDAGR